MTRTTIAVFAAVYLSGCASTQDVADARTEVAVLSEQVEQVNASIKADVAAGREYLVSSGQFSPDQMLILDHWQDKINSSVDAVSDSVAARIDPILDKLEPADLADMADGMGAVGRTIGGPWGAGLSALAAILGAGGMRAIERRSRRRMLDGVVGSVEAARSGDTVDWEKVKIGQNLAGVRREVRDSSMRVEGALVHH